MRDQLLPGSRMTVPAGAAPTIPRMVAPLVETAQGAVPRSVDRQGLAAAPARMVPAVAPPFALGAAQSGQAVVERFVVAEAAGTPPPSQPVSSDGVARAIDFLRLGAMDRLIDPKFLNALTVAGYARHGRIDWQAARALVQRGDLMAALRTVAVRFATNG